MAAFSWCGRKACSASDEKANCPAVAAVVVLPLVLRPAIAFGDLDLRISGWG